MGRFLIRHLDRIVIVLGLIALVFLGIRTVQNLARTTGALSGPPEVRRDFGDLTVLYTLNAGNNKPLLLNRYGDPLLEYSGWSSFVTVDGVTLDLWAHAFNVDADPSRRRVILTLSTGRGAPQRGDVTPREYLIEQQVDVRSSLVRVRYYIVPTETVRTVRLIVGHFGWYLDRLRVLGREVAFTRPALSREGYERGETAGRSSAVRVRLGRGAAVRVLRTSHGAYGFETTYRLEAPPVYEKTLIAEEEVGP